MATGYQYELGYDDSRFEIVVSQRFHCPICFLVLKDPVMCKNQHYGCSSCIKKHLENSEFCPTCLEPLSVDTLSPAPRIVTDYLSELNIHCDFHSRGCPKLVQVGNLKSHVVSCGFSPVQCSNDGCNVLVNASDKLRHEAEVCDFRKLKCHDCGQLKKEVREINNEVLARQNQMNEEILARQNQMKEENLARHNQMKEEILARQNQMKEEGLALQIQVKEEMKAEFRNDIGGMKDEMKQVKIEIKGMKNEIKNETKGMKTGVKEMKNEVKEMKNEMKGVKSGMKEMKNEIKGELKAEMRGVKEEMKGEIKEELEGMKQAIQVKGQMKEVIIEMKGMKNEIKNEMKGVKKEMKGINEMKEAMKEMKDEIKFEVKEEMKKEIREIVLTAMQSLMYERTDEKLSSQALSSCNGRASIIVAGGKHTGAGGNCVRSVSVEMFQWLTQSWKMLNPMLIAHCYASSFVHEGNMVVVGGTSGYGSNTDRVESLNVTDPVATWEMSAVKLPGKRLGHKVVHHKSQLIMSGGWVELTGDTATLATRSDGVFEIQLLPPYTCKMLTRLPKPISNHGMELFDEKVFILGGEDGKATSSVVQYDLVKNECKEMPPLPYEVEYMATVLWRNKVLVLGGIDAKSSPLSSVVMYDVITGCSQMLPNMKHKRRGCTAVLTGNVVVVMGGQNEEGEYLKSVECFDLESQVWQDLPDMLEARAFATAVKGT